MAKTFSPKDTVRYLWRSFSFFGKKRGLYLLGAGLSALQLITAYFSPVLYRQIVEFVSGNHSKGILYSVILMFVLFIAAAPLIIWGNYLKTSTTAYATGEMRKAFFSHVQSFSLADIYKHKQGEFITRMSTDIPKATSAFESYSFVNLTKFFLYTIISVIVLCSIHWILAVIGIVMGTCTIISAVFFNPRLRRLEEEARNQLDHSASFLMEILRGIMSIRVYLMERDLSLRFRRMCSNITKRRISYRSLNGMAEGFKDLLSFSTQAIGLIVGVLLAGSGKMKLSDAVFAAGILAVMLEGAQGFIMFMNFIQPNLVACKRVFEVMDMPTELSDIRERNLELTDKNELQETAIDLDGVSFSYGNEPVLSSIDLHIRKGENIAIVGGSGGGKTTLLKLIMRLYRPDNGKIRIFGTELDRIKNASLHQQFAYVPQDNFMFDCSLAENISYGSKNATMEDIIRAARNAKIDDFIQSLPQGYDTMAGEGGSLLSGGQKQRIAIARAFVKDAPILLLDEATASLDAGTEKEVNQAIYNLMQGRTVLIVSHKLHTIQNADRILVMEHGRILQQGTHASLLAAEGRYKELQELYSKV